MPATTLERTAPSHNYTELPADSDSICKSGTSACSRAGKNVSRNERLASLVGGTALVLAGRQRGSWSGLLLAAAGAGLLFRSATGRCYLYKAFGVSTAPSMPGGEG